MCGKDYEVTVPLKTTQWFAAKKSPKKKGFYERRIANYAPYEDAPMVGSHLRLDYWDGKQWIKTASSGKPLGGYLDASGRGVFWRGLIEVPRCDYLPGGLKMPEEHHVHLSADFPCDVSISNFSESERRYIDIYGALLQRLMIEEIEPVTKQEIQFVEMCRGNEHPHTELERVWKKYRLEVMYDVAQRMEKSACKSGIYDFEIYRERFLVLALHGHAKAREWVRKNDGFPQHYNTKRVPVCLLDVDPPKVRSMYVQRLGGNFGGGSKG
jgi:uncharacterized protein YifE (UPF0438 family)